MAGLKMKIGYMNDPRLDVFSEVKWAKSKGFDYLELTLEKPNAYTFTDKLINKLRRENFILIGHTFSLLQVGSLYERVRKAAVKELKYAIDVFSYLGVRQVVIHVDSTAELINKECLISQNLKSIQELVDYSKYNVQILIEHFNGIFSDPLNVKAITDQIPEVGVTLDVSHANLFFKNSKIEEFISTLEEKIEHVHMSDNYGGMNISDDKHLELGKGNIDWKKVIVMLRNASYDGRITLEVFQGKESVVRSKNYLKKLL